RQGFLLVDQSPVGRDDEREAGDQRQRVAVFVIRFIRGTQADRAGGHAQRIHKICLLFGGGPQQVERVAGQCAVSSQPRSKIGQLLPVGQRVVPQQVGHLLKGGILGNFFQREASNNEFAKLAVHAAQACFGGDNA